MINELGNIGLAGIRRITNLWAAGKADSLIDYTSVTRVEPITLVDDDVVYADGIDAVMQSVLARFAGYYLQAVAISTPIGKISVQETLSPLNPKRDSANDIAISIGNMMATESYKHRLPSGVKLTLEGEDKSDSAALSFSKDTIKTMNDVSNLSVGKLFSIELSDGVHRKEVPISIRLRANNIPPSSVVHILSRGNKDTSVKERYHAWRSGQLEFIRDLWLCQDLIDAHRKNLINDANGNYTEIINRRRTNGLATLVSGMPSVATASTIVIISDDTASKLEMEVDGDLDNFKLREKLFKETSLMMLIVINKKWNRVVFYDRGLSGHTELSMSALKSAAKGSGPDVSEILKAYQVGQNPSL